jgi:hypothetical protein
MPRKAPRILIVALVVQLLVGGAFVWLAARDFAPLWDGGSGGGTAGAATRIDRFDGDRAHALLRRQVERYGPRPAGSDSLRRLAVELRGLLPRGRFEALPRDLDPAGRLRNVVGRIPGTRPAIVVGAHYDVEAAPEGFVGANDGAAGTAAVVELARVLRRADRPRGAPEIRFVLFDGEEEPAGCEPFDECGIRGSRAYARAHADEVRALVLLDYVAERGARFAMEGTSDPQIWSRLRASARRVGALGSFPEGVGVSLIDDHTPFLEAGVAAIDVIDFDYPHRDTLRDTVDKTSARTLDAVGETVADLLLHWRP